MSTMQRSNAATARLLTLVRPAETQFSTRLTEHKHERPEMVISKTTNAEHHLQTRASNRLGLRVMC